MTMNRPRMDGVRRRTALTISVSICAAVGACSGNEPRWQSPDQSAVFGGSGPANNKPLPKYADIVAGYNKRVVGCDRIIARANIKLTYFDSAGEQKTEQPEGTLQVITTDQSRPKLALSLGKAGQTLFWFGTDGDRYWWLDLTDKNDRVAGIGKLALFDAPPAGKNGGAKKRLGLTINPTDLIKLLGIVPLDPRAGGQLQWSRDGEQLGVVTRSASGRQRLWLDPKTLIPRTIELYDAKGKLSLVSEHEGQENVEITRTGIPELVGARPRVPARVYCRHETSGTDIRLTLTGVKEGPISDKAFQLDEIMRIKGVDRTIDFDK